MIASNKWCPERVILESAPPSSTIITPIPAPQNRVILSPPKKQGRKWFQDQRRLPPYLKPSPTRTRTMPDASSNLKIFNRWDSNLTCWTIRLTQKSSKTVHLRRDPISTAMAKTNNRQQWLAQGAVPTHLLPMSSTREPRCFLRVFQNHPKYWYKELRGISTLMIIKISIFIQNQSIRI